LVISCLTIFCSAPSFSLSLTLSVTAWVLLGWLAGGGYHVGSALVELVFASTLPHIRG
jgi:hypothetical protein